MGKTPQAVKSGSALHERKKKTERVLSERECDGTSEAKPHHDAQVFQPLARGGSLPIAGKAPSLLAKGGIFPVVQNC